MHTQVSYAISNPTRHAQQCGFSRLINPKHSATLVGGSKYQGALALQTQVSYPPNFPQGKFTCLSPLLRKQLHGFFVHEEPNRRHGHCPKQLETYVRVHAYMRMYAGRCWSGCVSTSSQASTTQRFVWKYMVLLSKSNDLATNVWFCLVNPA